MRNSCVAASLSAQQSASMVTAKSLSKASRCVDSTMPLVAMPVTAPPAAVVAEKPRRRGRFGIFVLGFILGALALFAFALFGNFPEF